MFILHSLDHPKPLKNEVCNYVSFHLSIITNNSNWRPIPALRLDQFSGSSASSALPLPRMRGRTDRLMKRGILYRPSTEKHKTRGERGGAGAGDV